MDKKYIQQYKNLIKSNIADKEISDKICKFIDFLNDNINGLEKNNSILINKLNKNIDINKSTVYVKNYDYIDNAHPGNSWKQIHEMGC